MKLFLIDKDQRCNREVPHQKWVACLIDKKLHTYLYLIEISPFSQQVPGTHALQHHVGGLAPTSTGVSLSVSFGPVDIDHGWQPGFLHPHIAENVE